MKKEALRITRLRKIYGGERGTVPTTALKDVSFTVHAGEFVAVMGPSGSGKTTLLNLLAGIDVPTAGEILIDGQAVAGLDRERLAAFRRRILGFVFQDYNLLDTLTLAENVALPLLLERRDVGDRVRQTLALLGIDELADRFPHQVSGGQQQRAAIGRAIVHNPAVVLADEPTGNLDSHAAKVLMGHLATLNKQQGVTLLMVTHDPQAASYATRVLFVKDGEIHSELACGAASSKNFLGSILARLGDLEGAGADD